MVSQMEPDVEPQKNGWIRGRSTLVRRFLYYRHGVTRSATKTLSSEWGKTAMRGVFLLAVYFGTVFLLAACSRVEQGVDEDQAGVTFR